MPVVDVLKNHATLNDSSGILVHILSNGTSLIQCRLFIS
jgi:hypothetical protein